MRLLPGKSTKASIQEVVAANCQQKNVGLKISPPIVEAYVARRPASYNAKMSKPDFSSLSRPIHPLPDFVQQALTESGLMVAYRDRPPYQQNDYIGWINRAKRIETKLKRLDQMLDELRRGDVYMKMAYNPRNTKK